MPSPDFTKTLCGSNSSSTSSELPVYPLVTELAAGTTTPPPADMAAPHAPDMAMHAPDMAMHARDMATPPSPTGFSVAVGNAHPAKYASFPATFTAPKGEASTDFVGIFSPGADNWTWQYATPTNGATAGSVTLVAPGRAGKYEVRYVIKSSYTAKAVVPLCVGSGC